MLRELALICIALPVAVASSIWKPLLVWAALKLKRTMPLLIAPVVALVSDIRLAVSAVLLEFRVRSLV